MNQPTRSTGCWFDSRNEWEPFVAIEPLASRKHGTLYVGVTNNLLRRVHEHREGLLPGFTRKYGVKHLVYYEAYQDVGNAINREKALKEWRRAWKIALIEQSNPEWTDLYSGLAA